jgi:cytochrome c556
MRRTLSAAGVAFALAASVYAADLDFSDFDDTTMRSMDDAVKDLDSNVGGQDAEAALANAAVLRDGLAWAEQYFSKRTDTPLAPGFAREAQQHLAALTKALEAKDFDAAHGNVRAVVKTCKSCHEAYKPPD